MLLNSCAVFIDAHTIALYAHNSVNFPQVLQKEQKQSTRKRPVKHSRRLFFFFFALDVCFVLLTDGGTLSERPSARVNGEMGVVRNRGR